MAATARSVLEVTLSWLFANAKGRDAKSFFTRPALAGFPEQSITVTSPDCGVSGSRFKVDYTHDGDGKFPALQWSAPPEITSQVKQWLLVSEDPDAPLPTPIIHGIYTAIPASKTSVDADDFTVVNEEEALMKGGFHYGRSRNGMPYIPPRPLMNHGPHRYFFMVVALNEELEPGLLTADTTREQIAEAIEGKVLGWGMWVGVAERKWE
ncbi:phosphatidylethanolamine-binding protein [Xylaria flabelliformis]|nr:phosphatidylethanolamine-binding protein [Xylaria flabelliformis]